MQYLRWLLFPFSLIYCVVVMIRNWCYNRGVFKSYTAKIPVVSVGNLDVGGAGKSPMTEYLVRLFKDNYKLATLSRGYGRKTKGYIEKSKIKNQKSKKYPRSTAEEMGDEPAQFHQKFVDITVAVSEDRVYGIKQLQTNNDLVILDDAYQHRALKPGLSILLFDFSRLSEPRLLLPAGNLRESFSGRKRADVIVISKCPESLSSQEQAAIIEMVKPFPNQQLFFTSIAYQSLQNLEGKKVDILPDKDTTVFLLTGIANAKPLVQHLKMYTQHIIHHNYPDHHRFSLKNIAKLAAGFSACASKNKLVITTEKDAQRLLEHELLAAMQQLPILVLPIGVKFMDGDGPKFDKFVTGYVREYTKHH
jgi:tetraacyldisaccharide 4'-kinase